MTLLKTALSKFRPGEGTVGVAEGWMSLLSSAVTKDIFWDSSRRFVKYLVAVMKKFHGSSVPRPSMKKISQTALYLS